MYAAMADALPWRNSQKKNPITAITATLVEMAVAIRNLLSLTTFGDSGSQGAESESFQKD